MARSIAQIEAEFDAALESETEIFDITGNDKSKLSSIALSSIWKLFRSVLAVGIFTLENIFDASKEEIQSIVDANVVHNGQWFHDRAFEFQDGDLLTVVDGKPGYIVPDDTKKIITRAAVIDIGGFLTLKVAKGTETLEPLTTSQLAAYKAYWNSVQPAGVALLITSVYGDVLKITGDATFDPIIGASGTEANLYTKADEYLKNLKFNGEFIVKDLDDYIQQSSGIKDDKFNLKYFIKSAGGTYSEVSKSRTLLAGWATLNKDDSEITFESYL